MVAALPVRAPTGSHNVALKLSGPLHGLVGLQHLTDLNLGWTNITGRIPEMCRLGGAQLTHVYMAGMRLTGAASSTAFAECSRLLRLVLEVGGGAACRDQLAARRLWESVALCMQTIQISYTRRRKPCMMHQAAHCFKASRPAAVHVCN